MAPAALKPFQLLEVNLISAQDLEPVTKKMRTYCKSWVHPNRKLTSCVDTEGNNNPTWNDKFVFRVNEEFLREDNSAVMIEIYTPHWFRDTLVGTVRVLVGNLFPPSLTNQVGMRFVALQVRRPSGRPQGILNIGVALLDGCLRSMPLYKGCSSAVGYRDLMLDLPPNLQWPQQNDNDNDNNDDRASSVMRPMLLRSRSERSIGFDNFSTNGSMVAAPQPTWKAGPKNSSILSISEPVDHPFIVTKGKGKASSVINGAEFREKPKEKGKKGKASSVVSDSLFSKSSSFNKMVEEKPALKSIDTKKAAPAAAAADDKLVATPPKEEKSPAVAIGRPVPIQLGKYVAGGPYRGSSILSSSEIGPSPSEMACMMAERRYPLNNDNESSVLDGWSLDESIEGLKSKLQRWRTELPPLYDHHGYSSASYKSSAAHSRSRSESSSGLFSCFGNICGYECQCIIGQPPSPRQKGRGSRFSSSVGSPTRSSLL